MAVTRSAPGTFADGAAVPATVAAVAGSAAPGTSASLSPGFLADRLGIDHPAGWWPSKPVLKSYDATGFALVQVRMPSRTLLEDRRAVVDQATALREALRLTGLRVVLHAPDDLLAGSHEHDVQLDGALTYAWVAGSDLVVYHGARIPIAGGEVRGRLANEERSLRRALRRAAELGIRLAIENLAPVYPGPELVCHDPGAVAGLVRRLDSEHAGMCLDIGHAHIAAELAGCGLLELIDPVLERVILFHVHDNLGARARGRPVAGASSLSASTFTSPPGRERCPGARSRRGWLPTAPPCSSRSIRPDGPNRERRRSSPARSSGARRRNRIPTGARGAATASRLGRAAPQPRLPT
ncbi:MAG TPA: sugar phosphate isomerase/epimerase [Solirubrobacteraceae bacterium]|nr:sugar phosphate isomerase/epimerase [Solirubrobacteraceae bacterium]